MKKLIVILVCCLFPYGLMSQNEGNIKHSFKNCRNDTCFSIKFFVEKLQYDSGIQINGKLVIYNYYMVGFLPSGLCEDYMSEVPDINDLGKYNDIVYQFQKVLKNEYCDYKYPPSGCFIDKIYNNEDEVILPHKSTYYNLVLNPYRGIEPGKYRVRVYFNAQKYADCNNIWSNWVYFEIVSRNKNKENK